MKRYLSLILLGFSPVFAISQATQQPNAGHPVRSVPPPVPAIPAPASAKAAAKTMPTIPVELREKFFKAQAEAIQAASSSAQAAQAAQIKNTELQAQMEKVRAACGTEYVANFDADGEVVCVDKPKVSAPAPEKK